MAEEALKGFVFAPVGNATHYHANYVVPYWASSLAKNAVLGAHIFYRWAGGWGRPPAFTQRYSKVEPSVEALRSAAILAEQREREQATTSEAAEAEAIAEIPGAEELKLVPSLRGDERVAIRFNLAARKAAEQAPRVEYIQKVEASDNLRWSLTGDQVAADEKPLGPPKPKPTPRTGAADASGAVAAGAAAGGGEASLH
ncbi:MAG: cell wall hydrolase [Sphingomonas sp.]|nr:cell wall hydrolase [Sphingomonas sp.]